MITTLNANVVTKTLKRRQSSNSSTIHRTRSRPISKPSHASQIAHRKQDYPNVKHWERRPNDAIQFSVIKVYSADSSDCDSDEGITNRETGVLAFLEDENGNVISCHERRRLYSELRGFWNDNIDQTHPPNNWSAAGANLRDKFRDTLEEKFPFLRFCAGRWKVEALWKKNYHSWKRSLLDRQTRTPGRKRKQRELSEPVISNSETELLDVPQPKKRKAMTASIPTMSRPQKVRRCIVDSHLTIMKGRSERWGHWREAGYTCGCALFLPRCRSHLPPNYFFSTQRT